MNAAGTQRESSMATERPLSLEKARALNRYARGEITLDAMAHEISNAAPEEAKKRLWVYVAAVAALLSAFLVPASVRRE